MSIRQALDRLLQNTGLAYRWSGDHTVTIAPRSDFTAATDTGRPRGGNRTVPQDSSTHAGMTAYDPGSSSAGGAFADGGSAGGNNGAAMLEEIVVTAQKRAQRLIDVPMSITALDGRALRQAGISTMLALSYAVPSLVVQQTGGGYQRYFIRGIGNGNSPISLVGVYVDDADITNNGNTQLDFQPTDLQRIEVLKGPQGTLYGDGSAGGTIRFITNDPDLKHYSATGDFETYATQYGSPSQELTAIVNAPLAKNVFGLRMVGTAADLGGWIDQPATGRTNINDQNLSDVRLKALWTPARAATVKALVDIHRNHGNGTDSGADANYVLTLAVDPTARTPFESNF
ncbi:MAG: TonB-dependent receptor plug domain-containing protein, partial [Proteobacteria bacterium]|nr:TonB-dependent receptor plug domain-containing protein [Pseudomonadota bacterium]